MDESFALLEQADKAVQDALLGADYCNQACVSRYEFAADLIRDWRRLGMLAPVAGRIAAQMLAHDREMYIAQTAEAMLIAAGAR